MGKIFDEIDDRLAAWIAAQQLFFVATAPSGDGGHVNCSPKGPIESLRVLGPRRTRTSIWSARGPRRSPICVRTAGS
jgi:hypothetical protein